MPKSMLLCALVMYTVDTFLIALGPIYVDILDALFDRKPFSTLLLFYYVWNIYMHYLVKKSREKSQYFTCNIFAKFQTYVRKNN